MKNASINRKFCFCVMLGLFLSGELFAQQLYKIVDKDGNVTFSQHPPLEAEETETMESVNVSGANSGKTPLTRVGTIEYCGDIELPKARLGKNAQSRFLEQVSRNRNSWKSRLQSLEQRISQENDDRIERNSYYNQNSRYKNQRDLAYSRRLEQNVETMSDLRCALAWVDGQQEQTSELTANASEEVMRLEKVHQQLQEQQLSRCGEEPLLDPSDPVQKGHRQDWLKCSRPYAKDIRSLERRRQDLLNTLNDIR